MKTRKVIYAPLQIYVCTITYYLLSAVALCAASNEKPKFTFVPDDNGILWIKGEGSPATAAIKMAYDQKGFVILLGTSKAYKDQAVNHAKKLQAWFADHPHMPDEITILAFEIKKNTVVYSFCLCDGLIYETKEFPTGILSPEEAYRVRDHIVLTHRAAMVIRDRKGSYLD